MWPVSASTSSAKHSSLHSMARQYSVSYGSVLAPVSRQAGCASLQKHGIAFEQQALYVHWLWHPFITCGLGVQGVYS